MIIENNYKSLITNTRSEKIKANESKRMIATYYCDPIHIEIFIFSIGPRPIKLFCRTISFTLVDQFVLRVLDSERCTDSKPLLDSKNV